MKKTFCFFLLVFLTQSAFAQDILNKFPKPTASVNDFDNIFTDEEEINLNDLIITYNKRANAEIVIITIDEKSTTSKDFEDLTLQIANKWGVGSAEKNNGILIGISNGLKMIRIQNGTGIETRMTDDETKQIIDSVIIPKFKEGQYYKGTREGVKAIVNHLKNSK